jgi:hypothetical protein
MGEFVRLADDEILERETRIERRAEGVAVTGGGASSASVAGLTAVALLGSVLSSDGRVASTTISIRRTSVFN